MFWRDVLQWCDDDLVLASVGTLVVFIIPLCASCARTPTVFTDACCYRHPKLRLRVSSQTSIFLSFITVYFKSSCNAVCFFLVLGDSTSQYFCHYLTLRDFLCTFTFLNRCQLLKKCDFWRRFKHSSISWYSPFQF